ncbi:MAG TPA: family 43 glycosylhydrolase [Pyrinomonadaceae bacterium]
MSRIISTSCLVILCILIWCSGVPAQAGDATYTNPVMAGDYPDPSVIRVGSDYWATTTSGDWSPQFQLMRSRDLVNWEIVGAVFTETPSWAGGDFWAPEIREDKGRFFVYYAARKKKGPLCVAVATASKPAGPYTDHGPLVCQEDGSIDPFLIRDENNQLYLIWKEDGNSRQQPTLIWAQRLSEDGTKLIGKRTRILRNDAASWEGGVVEGSFILRHGDWFYHFYAGNACCGRGCNYAVGVARSHKLLGPWEKNPANPILAANEAWQCPGHGDIVQSADGRDFLLYHAYRKRADAFSIGREALLDQIKWNSNGWPTINDNKGPGETAPAPLRISERQEQTEFFDGFTAVQLSASWQWPLDNEQAARVEVENGGHLLLTTRGAADEWTGAALTQRTVSGDYVATAAIETRGLEKGAHAGLSVYSWRHSALGLAVGGDGKVYVWRREEKQQETLGASEASLAPTIFLRITVTGGETFRFFQSDNGRDWKELGEPVSASYIEGARVALTCGGTAGATARFDWLKITSTFTRKG